jgi:hypothetical protein
MKNIDMKIHDLIPGLREFRLEADAFNRTDIDLHVNL